MLSSLATLAGSIDQARFFVVVISKTLVVLECSNFLIYWIGLFLSYFSFFIFFFNIQASKALFCYRLAGWLPGELLSSGSMVFLGKASI